MKLIVLSLILAVQVFAQRGDLRVSAVYVMTNQTENSVMAFIQQPYTGYLTFVGTEPTGGTGIPVPSIDPLGSQGALVHDEQNAFVYAVNAGSNDISVLAVESRGLRFVQRVPSGGTRPTSLAIRGSLLYVLNAGAAPNITGFRAASDGRLTLIPNSNSWLIGGQNAGPAQVAFNATGTQLVVTEKFGNRLNIYNVGMTGIVGPPTAVASSGSTPFGFAFDSKQHLYVSESTGNSSVSSYDGNAGYATVTASLHNGQSASCWAVTAFSNLFVSNTGSHTISAYGFNAGGSLSLLLANAADTGTGSFPTDMAVSTSERYLYVLEAGSRTISVWTIGRYGMLVPVAEFGTLPQGAQGIAAR